MQRPLWLNKKISLSACDEVKNHLRDLKLSTVCEEASCPNIGECFARKEATFLILGRNCTRSCAFCGIAKGSPAPADPSEPERVAAGVRKLGLKYVVITSVTRDDLADGGASAFSGTINVVRRDNPGIKVEVLIPDFGGDIVSVRMVADAAPEVIAHNVETVPRLYHTARKGANYGRSLGVLRYASSFSRGSRVKSGLMLGLGEKEGEVMEVLRDLAEAGCTILSIGQYLAPTNDHLPVVSYIPPEKFDHYKAEALKVGFKSVMSGPYVRSSYMAGDHL